MNLDIQLFADDTENETPIVEEPEVKEEPKPDRTQILRELSKETGLNLFDAEGLKKLKDLQESQKTEQEKLQEQLEFYKNKETEWQKSKLDYESKLKASELGIKSDLLTDALKLAEGNPDNLEEVIKRYPMFKSTEGIKIGLQEKEIKPPNQDSEIEAYMASNPIYKNYRKK